MTRYADRTDKQLIFLYADTKKQIAEQYVVLKVIEQEMAARHSLISERARQGYFDPEIFTRDIPDGGDT